MVAKNITYSRLKKGIPQSQLAKSVGVTPMAISNYEKGLRTPDLTIARKIADALDTDLAKLMDSGNDDHKYIHCEFRKLKRLSKRNQDYVCASVEDYFDRFLTVTDFLGQGVLRDAPVCHAIEPDMDAEADAQKLRAFLGFSAEGPIPNLVGALENKGILIFLFRYENDGFSGMNGLVDDRPYIIINSAMTAERQRSTLAHELAHVFFKQPNEDDTAWEKHMTAVSGAFLFPEEDAYNELGYKRHFVSGDMLMVAKEYGISLQLLAKRANVLKILTDDGYRDFNIRLNQAGGKKIEGSHIPAEESNLFLQLVLRAVGEEQISISKGAELLQIPLVEMRRKLVVGGV